jgi:CheY-like chemotaxis protein/HD-like signal output (HDOD) protein
MANVLLLDESDVAGQAMRGILARGHHGCLIAKTLEEALARLRDAVVIDLVFLEVHLPHNAGFAFLQRLRDDCFWKKIPVVIYTSAAEPAQVKKAIALQIQGFLIKPYRDTVIYDEIAKATANPWRNLHFEEPRSFCAQMGLTPDGIAKLRRDLMARLDECAQQFPKWTTKRENATVFEQIDALANDATTAGVWAVVDYLAELRAQAEAENWAAFKYSADALAFAGKLIFHQLNPSYLPDCLRSAEEIENTRLAAERTRWLGADVDQNGPVIAADIVKKQVAGLPSCPVIDTSAAAFLMAADGRAQSVNTIMELVAHDPGLCAQVLIAANKLDGDASAPTDDPASAVNLLGVLKLNALAKSTATVPERHMRVPPITWANFWLFQVAVGRLAQFICDYLEFPYLRGKACTAGVLHDLGKLLLLRLYPFGFQAMVGYAQKHKLPLHEAERRYIGCTTRELGALFAEHHGLPPVFSHVIRWVETPDQATEHTDLVAMVSLARHVCLHNHVGYCGDTPNDSCPPIRETAAWRVLQPRLFPSFDLAKFEAQAHAYCLELRQELLGRPRSGMRTVVELEPALARAS